MKTTAILALGVSIAAGVELRPATLKTYEDYWSAADRQLRDRSTFLLADGVTGLRSRVKQGEVHVEERRAESNPPHGLIHHWEGSVFIPSVNLPQVLQLVQNYDRHKDLYGPEVMESQTIERHGNDFRIRLRLLKKKIITVVLETEHEVHYRRLTPTRWESVSRSRKISEVENPGEAKEKQNPPGAGHGFVWRMDSFWRFEEADGGVYVECTSISLSRDVPFGMARLIRPIISDLPESSLRNILTRTRRALGTHEE